MNILKMKIKLEQQKIKDFLYLIINNNIKIKNK